MPLPSRRTDPGGTKDHNREGVSHDHQVHHPCQLEETLRGHLRQADYDDATVLRSIRYVIESDQSCLRASVHKYASLGA